MFGRLFGTTIDEQLNFLQPRVLITAPVIIFGFIAMAFGGGTGSAVIAIAAYVWAWTFMKNWFGLTTLGALFSGNVVMGVILFVVYLVIGYVIGLITFVLGLIRYIQLVVTMKK